MNSNALGGSQGAESLGSFLFLVVAEGLSGLMR